MAKIFTAFSGATADGVSPVFNVGAAYSAKVAASATLLVSATGVSETLEGFVGLEISLDGTNWAFYPSTNWSLLGGISLETLHDAASVGLLPGMTWGSDGANPASRNFGESPRPRFRYIRARIHGLAGGDNPTISAQICVSDLETLD